MRSYKMEVSKKENGAYVKQGEVEVFYPTLEEMGIDIPSTGDDEEGFPLYADERVQWVSDAVLAAVRAKARNKLVSGTATLKDGLSIASTVEELIAEAERSGEALANRREAIKALVAFVPAAGKSAAVQAWVAEQCKNLAGIQFQSAARKQLLTDIAEAFASSLTPEQASKFSRFLIALTEAASAVASLDDDLPA